MSDAAIPDILGAAEFAHWFGRWPSFHDAEVVEIAIRRGAPSEVVVHTFDTTSDLGLDGTYECKNHVLVSFRFLEVKDCELIGFNRQNVISCLTITHEGADTAQHRLVLSGCYGVEGWIAGKGLCVSYAEGKPSDSIYANK